MGYFDLFKGSECIVQSDNGSNIRIEINSVTVRFKNDDPDYGITFVTDIKEDDRFIFVKHVLPSDIAPDADKEINLKWASSSIILPDNVRSINVQTTVFAKDEILAVSIYRNGRGLKNQSMAELYGHLTNGFGTGFNRV